MELGGLWWTSVLNSALPPQRHRSDTQPEHQDPVSHMAQKEREEKERKKERKRERERERERERGREGGREGGKKERK